MLSSGLRKVMKALLILLAAAWITTGANATSEGERAPGLADKRFVSTYLYAAVRPATATDDVFALVLPEVNANTMDVFIDRFRRAPRAEHPRRRAARSSRRSQCRWEEPSTASKACMFLSLMGCLEPTEVVEESRFSSYIQGLQRQRYAYSDYIGFSRARLSSVSPPEPVVVDADCLKLELHRPHDQHHVLDYRRCFHRDHLVHGLLRIPLPSPAGKTGGVRSGEQEARVVADHSDRGGRRGYVGSRFVRMEPICHGPARGVRGRGRRPAVAVELPPSGGRRPARHVRYPVRQYRQPFGLESKRSRRAR